MRAASASRGHKSSLSLDRKNLELEGQVVQGRSVGLDQKGRSKLCMFPSAQPTAGPHQHF